MRTLGIDFSTDPAKTAGCLIDWKSNEVVIVDGPMTDAAVVAAVTSADYTAIDVPLGWPDAFVQALSLHREGHRWPSEDGDRDQMNYRLCDRRLRDLGSRPLSVTSDRIGATAMRGAHVQRLLQDAGVVIDRSGMSGGLAEAYPAAALRAWGLEHQKYKGSRNRPALERLSVALVSRCGRIAESARTALEDCDDDGLDAFVCALVARAIALGLTTPPQDEVLELVRREGWIHVPTMPVEDLVR